MIHWAGVLLLGVVVLLVVLPWGVRKALFPAPRAGPSELASRVPGLEVVHLLDGEVEAWWMPPLGPPSPSPSPSPSAPAPALIFFHGNGELIDHWVLEFQVARRFGMGVFLVEFPGYGRSGGSSNEDSIRALALAAYDHLASSGAVDRERIVAYGRSLGGGAAGELSRRRKLAALILESTFTNVRELVANFGLPRVPFLFPLIVRDVFDNETAVASFEGPILIVHGERDTLIPVAHARRLDEVASDSRIITQPCGHNDCPRPWNALRDFLVEKGIAP